MPSPRLRPCLLAELPLTPDPVYPGLLAFAENLLQGRGHTVLTVQSADHYFGETLHTAQYRDVHAYLRELGAAPGDTVVVRVVLP